MAYKINNTVTIGDDRGLNFANVTVQNNGFLEVNSSDGFQGTVAGYTSGGDLVDTIDKFPFASDSNATDVGNLTLSREAGAGQSSKTHGYTSGGNPPRTNTIDKFPFAVDTNASNVGDLFEARTQMASQSSSTHGYSSGGNPPAPATDTIDKFPFAVDANATDVGDLTQVEMVVRVNHQQLMVIQVEALHLPQMIIIIYDKFPFATDTNATDVGDLTQARLGIAGQSSTTHGYASGGGIPAPNPLPL
jgi:hypothetical protein